MFTEVYLSYSVISIFILLFYWIHNNILRKEPKTNRSVGERPKKNWSSISPKLRRKCRWALQYSVTISANDDDICFIFDCFGLLTKPRFQLFIFLLCHGLFLPVFLLGFLSFICHSICSITNSASYFYYYALDILNKYKHNFYS